MTFDRWVVVVVGIVIAIALYAPLCDWGARREDPEDGD